METKNITKLENNAVLPIEHNHITDCQLKKDYQYYMAQKMLSLLLSEGLITIQEFNMVSNKNREVFSPYFSEIMPKMT